MISYAFLDDSPPPISRVVKKPKNTKMDPPQQSTDDNECNYLIMFFILGIIIMNMVDSYNSI